jgi:hypothetical protein
MTSGAALYGLRRGSIHVSIGGLGRFLKTQREIAL